VKLIIKKATVRDARNIHTLINRFARKDKMLPRSLNEIYEDIRSFYICKDRDKIVGTSSLNIMWEDLAEIRSIAVLKEYRNSGIGRKLISRCLKEAKGLGVKKVFVLTYNPEYFIKLGFKDIDKNSLPQKIWGECLKCPKFPQCDEIAVIKTLR
jgi:amino-acid N-acetyltransferase